MDVHNLVFGQQTGVFRNQTIANDITLGSLSGNSPTPNTSLLSMDASRVARTSIETRAKNTALAPRIIAF